MIANGTKKRESTAPETPHRDEVTNHDAEIRHDEAVRHESGEETRRRSFSLRALLPGPYVRYPK